MIDNDDQRPKILADIRIAQSRLSACQETCKMLTEVIKKIAKTSGDASSVIMAQNAIAKMPK